MSVSAASIGAAVATPIAKKLLKFAKSKLSKKVADSPIIDIAADVIVESVSNTLGKSVEELDSIEDFGQYPELPDVLDTLVEQNFDTWLQALTTQIQETGLSMRVEAVAEDIWTRRWRPFFGFVFSGVYATMAIAIFYAVVSAASPFTALVQLTGLVITHVSAGAACLGTYIYQRSKRDKSSKDI